jgi:GDPmannose 4,6-dehydratase
LKRAFITGITGQDGSYLTEFLLEKGYDVHGLVRGTPGAFNFPRLNHLVRDAAIFEKRLHFHYGDLDDRESLRRAVAASEPEEIYHLGAQSHPGSSFDLAEVTCRVTGVGTVSLLEVIRALPKPPRFFHASSSEIFGSPAQAPQDETTPVAPVTPYGCAKAMATQMVRIARDIQGFFAVNGILFNHESPRRGEQFVTRKICTAAAGIKTGRQRELVLGDTSGQRDWGHARDYVRGMWLTLQQDKPDDFVFATGQLHSVQDVVELAFGAVQLDWRNYLKQNPALFRPADPRRVVGNAAKAKRVLGWEPQIAFEQLIAEMTRSEIEGALAISPPAP